MTVTTEHRRTTVAPGKFAGSCHKTQHAAGHRKGCTCTAPPVMCDLTTDQPTLFAEHMKTEHGITSHSQHAMPFMRTPPWVHNAAKPWKLTYSHQPFEPKPFDVGATVTWVTDFAVEGLTVRTGQVWARHYTPKTRWVVADSKVYAVRENEQLEVWLSVARARRDRGVRSNRAYDRNDAQYWNDAILNIERQLAELETA